MRKIEQVADRDTATAHVGRHVCNDSRCDGQFVCTMGKHRGQLVEKKQILPACGPLRVGSVHIKLGLTVALTHNNYYR